MSSATIAQTTIPSKRLSTSFKITLGFLISGMIIVLIGIITLLGQRYWVTQSTSILKNFTAAYHQSLTNGIKNGEALLTSYTKNPNLEAMFLSENTSDQITEFPDVTRIQLTELLLHQETFQDLLVVDPKGMILSSTQKDWIGLTLPDQWLSRLKSTKTTFATSTNQLGFPELPQSNPVAILSAVPFVSPSSISEYWMIGFHHVENLLITITSQESGPFRVFWIANEDNWLGINREGQLLQVQPDPSQLMLFQNTQATNHPEPGPEITHSVWGKSFAFFVMDDMGLTVAIETISNENLIPWLLSQNDLLLLLAIFLLFLIALFVAPGLLLRPLTNLTQETSHFANGNWEQRVSTHQTNELGLIAKAFNQLANEVQTLSRRLDTQTSDHNERILGLAKLSQIALFSPNLEELIRPVLVLTLKHFGYQYAALYLLSREPDGNYAAILRQGVGDIEIERNFIPKKVILDSIHEGETSVAKAFSTKVPAYACRQDPTDIHPGQADHLHELSLPITINEKVIGCLSISTNAPRLTFKTSSMYDDHQARGVISASTNISTTPRLSPFSEARIAELQTIANQISLAFRSFHSEGRISPALSVSENSEANLIYQAGAHIAQSENLDEAFAKIGSVLQEIPYSSALLLGEDDDIVIAQRWPGKNESSNRIIRQLPGKNSLPVSLRAISSYFKSSTPIIIHDIRSASLPQSLMDIPRQMGCDSAAFLPVLRDGKVVSILILGQSKEQKDSSVKRFQANASYNSESLQPYFYLIDTISSTIEKINSQQDIRKRLSEVQTLWNISQAISVENDLQALYKVIHNQAEKVMGKLSSFAVLLYDDQSGMIQVPYIIEEGKKLEIPPFPMGEGLTSIVMRTGMPLLIVEDMEKNIRELGAKTVGALAKSWLGVPLKYGGETFGVIIAQDIFRENRFSEEDQRLLSTIASQVALVIRNVRLLEISKSQARLERILNQITGKIRRAMDIETILQTTADELAYALNARKAKIKIEIAKTPKKNGKHTSLFVDSSSLKS